VTPTTLTARDAEDPGFWRRLCPKLHVEATSSRKPFAFTDVDRLVELVRVEGYVNVPGVLSAADVALLRGGIECLHERRIPIVFAFVYDEFWAAFRRVSSFIGGVLGPDYRALPDFWAWRVEPSDEARGWEPHNDSADPTFDRDNSPHTLTVWLALSDANPLNGCMYVIPAFLDERFQRRDWDIGEHLAVEDLQDIRALPAPAGSMLAWNQGVVHWGGRASGRAEAPRLSAAFEFQRADLPAQNEPLLDPATPLVFRERLALIGKQVLQYQHMYPLTADVQRIAKGLVRSGTKSSTTRDP
jgi:Phytanoyl-CoA dioxygenase (PhyH)